MSSVFALLTMATMVLATEYSFHVNTKGDSIRASKYLIGAGIEDVNHELYGGIYSQA